MKWQHREILRRLVNRPGDPPTVDQLRDELDRVKRPYTLLQQLEDDGYISFDKKPDSPVLLTEMGRTFFAAEEEHYRRAAAVFEEREANLTPVERELRAAQDAREAAEEALEEAEAAREEAEAAREEAETAREEAAWEADEARHEREMEAIAREHLKPARDPKPRRRPKKAESSAAGCGCLIIIGTIIALFVLTKCGATP